MDLSIKHISIYLPEKQLTNDELAVEFNTEPNVIFRSVGIENRFIAADDECASDMAINAAIELFKNKEINKHEIDFLIFCSECFDYIAPASSCIIQNKLGLPKTIGCFDLSYGCSGYVYGLGLAYGLLKGGIAKKILFLTADTSTKVLAKGDLKLRSIFSDIATASILELDCEEKEQTQFVFGTDGEGALDLYIENSCFRKPVAPDYVLETGMERGKMYMNGANVFSFAIKTVPKLINDILERYNIEKEQVDLFILHQASFFMLDTIIKKMGIPKDKTFLNLQNYGNSVSSTIPLALYDAEQRGVLKKGMTVLLAGFGIGYSWGCTIISF